MPEKLKPFNPFDFFETQEEINAYLQECFRDEDPNVFVNALGHLAKHHGIAEVSKATGLNRESLYKTFSGKVQPKWDTIARVMRAIHVDMIVEFDTETRFKTMAAQGDVKEGLALLDKLDAHFKTNTETN
jgi:probable addiction module antidote protein